MAAFADVVRFLATAGSTTDFVLSSVVQGYQTPAQANVQNAVKYKWRAESADLSQWEIFEGAWNSGTTTAPRTTVLYNSSATGSAAGQSGAGSKISFSAAPQVALVGLAEDLISVEQANSFTAAQQAQAKINIGVTADPRNIIGRNGGLEVWQRGTSVSVAASSSAGVYTADGWYMQTSANEAFTVARVTGLTSNSRFAAKVQRNSGQTGTTQCPFACALDADEIIKTIGNVLVLSFTAKSGANFSPASLGIYFATGTGAVGKRGNTGYTGEAAVINTTQVLTTTATRYSFISSAVGASVTQMEMQFYLQPVGTAGADDSFTIDDIQIEVVPSTSATAFVPQFERTDYLADLLRCQRHLFVGNVFIPATTAQNLRTLHMRAVPAISGGGSGFTSTGTTADSLIGFQTAGAVQTLTVSAEI